MSQVSAHAAGATGGAATVQRGGGTRGADAPGGANGSDAFMLAFSAAEADESSTGSTGSAAPASASAADPADVATPSDGSNAPAADATTGQGGVDHGMLLAQSALLGIDLGAPAAAAAAAAAASSAAASSSAATASTATAGSASSIAAIGLASGSTAPSAGATAGAAVALADPSKSAGTAADAGVDASAPVAAADSSGEAAVAPRGTRSISDRTTSRLGVDDPATQQRVRALGIEPDATRVTESLFGRSAAHAGSGSGTGVNASSAAGNGLQAQASAAAAAAAQRLAAQDDRQPAGPGAAPIGGAAVVSDSAALQAAATLEAMPRRIEGAKADAPSIRGAEPGSVSAAPSASPFMLPVDAAAAGASASHLEMAQRMVEQVSWWLSQKTQGAELKLEVMGGHQVSVSVQVQGNEAQVAFRSDHPETRHLLQQAMPQLKELLGNEGLMLANSSVGGHAQGAGQPSDGQGARPFQGREGAPETGTAVAEAPKPAPRVQSSRALDMYV